MTWIKTVTMEEDQRVKKAMEAQRQLYPVEYATPVHPTNNGQSSSIVASHSLIPVSRLQHVWRVDVARASAAAPPARNDRHYGFGDQPLRLLNRVPRRVSASRHIG